MESLAFSPTRMARSPFHETETVQTTFPFGEREDGERRARDSVERGTAANETNRRRPDRQLFVRSVERVVGVGSCMLSIAIARQRGPLTIALPRRRVGGAREGGA